MRELQFDEIETVSGGEYNPYVTWRVDPPSADSTGAMITVTAHRDPFNWNTWAIWFDMQSDTYDNLSKNIGIVAGAAGVFAAAQGGVDLPADALFGGLAAGAIAAQAIAQINHYAAEGIRNNIQ